jgi:AcrR family transcriptional regulator
VHVVRDEVGVHAVGDEEMVPEAGGVPLPGSRSPLDLAHRSVGARPGRSNEVARSTQRSRIIDAFAREVGERGFEDAHVGKICAAACVSTKDFYKHFESKKHCFCAALDEGSSIVVDRAVATYRETPGSWLERVQAALRTTLQILAENPTFARLCIVEPYNVAPMGREHLDAVVIRCRKELGGRLVPTPANVSRSDYERFLVASIIGPMSDYILEGKTARLPELEPLLTYALTLQSQQQV